MLDVREFVSEFDENANNLRLLIIESGKCQEIIENYNSLNNEEKSSIWKDRLIDGLKTKSYTEKEYMFLEELYKMLNPDIFIIGSLKHKEFEEYTLNKWKNEFRDKDNIKDLKSTLMSLTDIKPESCEEDVSDKEMEPGEEVNCNCRWGTYCDCIDVPCTEVYANCGIFFLHKCTKLCR